MANYTITTQFAPKDALPTGDAGKVIKGTEFATEFTNIAQAISEKADLISPEFTGTPTVPTAALNDNSTKIASTAFVQQEINFAVAAGTEGLDGESVATVNAYIRSATAPGTPTGGSFSFSPLLLTAPSSTAGNWYPNPPNGTDPVYMSSAVARVTGAETVDDTLTWSTPTIVFQNGADGSGTDTIAANGFLYYKLAVTDPPVAPTSVNTNTYNFSTSTFSVIKNNWTTELTAPQITTGTGLWAVSYSVTQDETGVQTVNISSAPFRWLKFDGLVTFTNLATEWDSRVTYINGGKIGTNTVNCDTLQDNSEFAPTGSNIKFGLGSNYTVNGFKSAGYFNSTQPSGTGYKFAINATSSNGTAIAGATASTGYAGAFFNTNSTTYSSASVETVANLAARNLAGRFENGSISVELATNSYAVLMAGAGQSGPFTGAHDGLINKTEVQPLLGDIVVDVSPYAKPSISDTICVNTVSTLPNQKGVVGVVAKYTEDHIPPSLSKTIKNEDNVSERIMDPQYTDINNYNKIVINALGEGQINVCGEGGSIEVGDLIVTSSMAGKGMKQADDIIRGYTVAKARESVTFTSADEVKQIACIYVAG